MRIDDLLSGTEYPDRRREAIDFETRQFADDLRSLRSSNITIPDLLVELERYSSVLESNGSIALNSGEILSSSCLSGQLARLFSTAVPEVIEGPSMTWAGTVFLAGPSPASSIDGSYQLKVGENRIQLPDADCMLLISGRPWKFLNPWPSQHDYEREHVSVNMALGELCKIGGLVHKVTQELNTVKQRLSSRHYLLSSFQPRPGHPNFQKSHGTYDVPFVPDRPMLAPELFFSAEPPVQQEEGSSTQTCSLQSLTDSIHAGLQGDPPGSLQDVAVTPASPPSKGQERPSFAHECTLQDTACQAGNPRSQSGHQSQHGSPDNNPGPPKIPSFIRNLNYVLNDPANSDLIRWSDKGNSFVITDRNSFAQSVLPKICNHNKYRAFASLLWHYGSRLKQDLSAGASPQKSWRETAVREYTYPHFQCGNGDGTISIRRKRDFNRSASSITASDSDFLPGAKAGSNLAKDCNQNHGPKNENRKEGIRRGPRFQIIKRKRIS